MRALLILLLTTLGVAAAPKVNFLPLNANPDPLASTLYFKTPAIIAQGDKIGLHTHKELLSCQPAIKASFSFSASRQVALYPHQPLKAGRTYRCKANVKNLGVSSSVITFTTKALHPKVERFGKIVRLSFNAPLASNTLQKHLKIVRTNRLSRTQLPFELTASKDRLNFTAIVKEDITHDALKVTLNRSLDTSLSNDLSFELGFKNELPIVFDKKRKTMVFTQAPRFIAKDDGSLAMRLYMPHYFYNASAIKKFLRVKGVDNFTLSSTNYIYSDERNKYKIPRDHNYYVDITSDAFQPNKSYTLTIKKGIKDSYSYQSRSDKSFTLTIGDRKPAMMFEGDKPYLSSQGEIGIKSVNIPQITIVVEKLLNQNYRYFTNFTAGNAQQVVNQAKEITSKKFTLKGKHNQFTQHKISLRPFMKKFDNGVYRIVLHYKDKKVAKSVYYSDIGITTKVSKDQIFVWTTKLSTGKPLSGATLKAYSNKNELLGVFKSNANGVAIFNKKNIAAAFPKVITAQESNDHNFLTLVSPLNKINVPLKESLKERFKAMIYVQSKLVRPGNDAKILVLLKDKDYIAAKNLPVKITVLAPNRRTFLETSKKTTSHGAIDLNLPIASDAKTGTYKITAMLGKHLIGSSSFSVENFMPQRIKNSIVFDHDKIVSGELLHATFNSKYLFGAPASGLKANAKLTAVSKRYTHEKYKKFNFTNEQLAKKNTINYLQTNKAFQLDKKGNAKIFFPTKIHQNPPSILTAQVALSVFDDGRAVSTYESVMLYPYPTMVGVALRNNRIEKGQELVMRTLRINPVTGEKIQGKVEAILKKSHWSYTYDSRGYYKWHQKMRIIDRKILDAGASYEKDVDESGDYVVELHDRLSGHSSTQNLTVSGWDYNPINPTHDMGKVQVSLANKAYTKGDTLHLDIKSPITKGSMLLTLEDEKVRWQRVIEIEKASASVDIPLKFNFSDGLYLRTSIVRATNTPSTMIPFRAQSSNFIKANKERFHQKVTLQTLSQNSSNNTQLIQVKAKPQTSVIVSVVDEGILQIKRQKVPKPFEFFQYIPKELIALFDLFDQVMHHITKGTMLSFGGDDSYEAKARRKHMAPKTGAKRVKPFVYWSGIVTTNAQGQAKVNLPIPNFNGEAKIVALAFDQQSVGVASQSLIIKDPIIIKPTFPRFISISDELTVPVRIFNTTKKAKTIKLSVKDNSQSRLKLSQNSVTIAANSSQLIDATLSAKAYGKGEVTILGSSDGKSYIASVEIPVYSAAALETKVYKGETKTDKKIIIDDKYFGPASTQLAMSLSNSYLSQLKGSVNNLLNYPYGCAEQTSSRLLALLHIEKFIQGKMDAHTKALLNDRKRFILEGIGRLEAMQKRSGEFGYWSLTSYINPYASIYTSDVILELSENGYKINNAILSRIFQALKNQANGLGSYRYSKTTTFQRIYAAYLLSRAKRLDRSVLNALYDQKLYQLNLVTRYMMAAILQNANQIQARNKVLKEIEAYNFTGLSNESQLGGSFYSKARNLSFALYIHAKHFQKNALSSRLIDAVMHERTNLHSTQAHAFIMRAMQEYYKDDKPKRMETRISYNGTTKNYNKPVTLHDELIQKQIIIQPKKGIVNYSFEVANFVKKPLQHVEVSRQKSDLKLQRNFLDEKGNIVNPNLLQVGDLFYSEIILSSNSALKNIVVSDRIASCFELVNERLGSHKRSQKVKNSRNFQADHQDIQDDKVLTFLSIPRGLRTYNSLTRSYQYRSSLVKFYQPMRISATGKCQMPAVVAEAMYDGRITAYDKEYETIRVSKKVSTQRADNLLKQKW